METMKKTKLEKKKKQQNILQYKKISIERNLRSDRKLFA